MRKIKVFLRSFAKSIIDVGYYKDILRAKFSFSLKYLYFLLFLLSLVSGLVFASNMSFLVPQIPSVTKKLESALTGLYPKELVLDFDSGSLTTNVKEPFYIGFPKEFPELSGGPFDHLIVIDTKADAQDITKYKTVFLLTDKAVVYVSRQRETVDEYRFYPYPDSDMVITQEQYKQVVDQVIPLFGYIRPATYALIALAIVAWPFIGALFGLISKLIYLLIFTLVVWLLAKVLKKRLSYGETYRLGMHGLTLPILIAFVLGFFNITLNFWLYTLVFLSFMVLVLVRLQKA